MRIVQINSVCDVESTGRIAVDSARQAITQGDFLEQYYSVKQVANQVLDHMN